MATIGIAMDLMEQSLMKLGSETPEGRAVLTALKTLSMSFADHRANSKELASSEIMQMMQSLPQTGNASPLAKMMQQHQQPQGMPPKPAGMPGMPM